MPSVDIVTVALRFASAIKRLLAETVAGSELGELDAFLVERRLAGHDAFAGDHDVEVIALGALLDHDVALAVVDALHAHENRLDVGGRDAMEGLGLQQRRHPIAGDAEAVAVQLGDLVLAGLVPGQQHVEQVAVDHDVREVVDRARGEFARQARRRAPHVPPACRRARCAMTRSSARSSTLPATR